jgi:hypothetical protein
MVAATLSAFRFLLAGALAVREVDDLCAGFLGDFLQFCPPEKGLVQSQFCFVHRNDGETGPACTLADVPALPDKDLGH